MSDMPDSMTPMNECERVQWELACLEPGETPRSETSEHVASCAECRAIAAELSGNREALASLNQDSLNGVNVPQEILPAVRAELDRELAQVSAASASHKWRWVAAAAVVLAVSTAAWQFTRVASVSDEQEAVVADMTPVTEAEPARASNEIPTNEVAAVAAQEPVAPPVDTRELPASQRPAQVIEVPQEPVEVQEEVLAAVRPPAIEVATRDFEPEEFHFPEFAPALAEPETSKETQTPTTMVKLLTEDPNVVIYWLIESETESTQDAAKKRL